MKKRSSLVLIIVLVTIYLLFNFNSKANKKGESVTLSNIESIEFGEEEMEKCKAAGGYCIIHSLVVGIHLADD